MIWARHRTDTGKSSLSVRASEHDEPTVLDLPHAVDAIEPIDASHVAVFGFSVSETLLIMVIVGGSGTLWGPVAGAVVFTALPEILRLTPEIRSLVYGAILLAIVVWQPRRLFP